MYQEKEPFVPKPVKFQWVANRKLLHMAYALILSSVACVLAVLAFSLVAQPALWVKLWSRRRRYILATDTASSAYGYTGIRLRLGLAGVTLAASAVAIPIAYASTMSDEPPSHDAVPSAITATADLAEVIEASPRVKTNSTPRPAGTTVLPEAKPAVLYSSPAQAAREFDPTLEPAATACAPRARRGANNQPGLP